MPRKMARQTLERHAGACYAGSRPYLRSRLLGSPANRYNLPHFRVHPRNPGTMDLPYNTSPGFTQWVVKRRLLQTKLVLVDVGVQGGIHPRWKALGGFLHVYGFDPLVETIEPLTKSVEPNHEYFAIALGDQDGERELFVPTVLPAASFFAREAEQDQARMTIDTGNWAATKTRRVPIRRLDTLSQRWPHGIDFMKLDCEGYEPAVLAGAHNSTSQVLAIETEIGFSSIHWPQTHFSAVYDQVVPRGFRLSNLAFDRVPFASYFQRAKELGREQGAEKSVSTPGTFAVLFSRSLTLRGQPPTPDQVLKSAIIFELYNMLDAAYDVLQVFKPVLPPAFDIQQGADLLIAND
jgi:FkbM family methyltransferase